MKISKYFVQESIIFLTIIMLTLSNGLFKRPFIFLFMVIMAYCSFNRSVNIKFIFNLIKRSYPILIVFAWCLVSTSWSIFPKNSLYELLWQFLLYIYVVFFIVTFLTVDNSRVLSAISISWIALTILFVLKNDLAHGRIIEISGGFANKNNFGPIISMMIFYYTFTIRRWSITNVAVLFLMVILLVMTFSKTSVGTTGLIVLLVTLFSFSSNYFTKNIRLIVYGPVRIGLWLLAIIVPIWVFMNYDQVFSFLYSHLQDDWLTGRGRLWLVMLNQSYGHLFSGLGYASVWGIGDYNLIQDTELAKYSSEWIDKLAASDGGYIDIFIAIGGVGLSLFVFLIFDFYKTYFKVISLGQSDKFTTLAFCLGTFAVINNITETTFLLAASFTWFNFIFAYLLLKSKVILDVENKYE